MNLPPRAIIGHRIYKLLPWPKVEASDERARGSHWDKTGEIKVADDLLPHDAAEVLIHELLHACWRGLPEDVEERCVTTLAENLAQVWADNPDVVRWISRKINRAALRGKSALKDSRRSGKKPVTSARRKRKPFN